MRGLIIMAMKMNSMNNAHVFKPLVYAALSHFTPLISLKIIRSINKSQQKVQTKHKIYIV